MFRIKKDYDTYSYKSVRLPDKIIEKLDELAKQNSLSFNRVVLQCIEFALNNMEDDEGKNSEYKMD